MDKLLSTLLSFMHGEKAQGLVEYMLILVLVSIVVVVILMSIGGTTNSMYSQINNAMP